MTVENNHRWPAPNHNYVPEFQMSGVPHVQTKKISIPVRLTANDKTTLVKLSDATAVACVITFDQVTRWINIINHENTGKHIRIYFNETAFSKAELNSIANGSGNDLEDKHYYRLDGGMQTNRLELKCKKIWIYPEDNDTTFSVIAGLTNVPSNTFPDQTKANGFTGVED
jgi:hypothetical protein